MRSTLPSAEQFSFWHWFVYGCGGKRGLRRLFDRYIAVHAVVGLLLVNIVPVGLQAASNSVLLPIAGVFIGLSFAWVGNAHALLQSDQIRRLARNTKGGLVEYAFVYQTAILVIIATLAMWGLAGLGVVERWLPAKPHPHAYACTGWFLYTCLSLCIREMWHVVLGAQYLLICQANISDAETESDQG